MKKVVFLFTFILAGIAAQAQEIKWMSFNEALAAQAKERKPIFMDVYTNWCGPCKMLDAKTFSDEKFIAYISKNYYAVKFNAEGDEKITFKNKQYTNPNYDANRKGRNAKHEFTSFLKVPGYPTMVIVDEKGNIKQSIVGYHTSSQLLNKL
ncbi:thioredoxin family protein [Sphingobacterium sp. MYb382]|uniref:thioredoxin family protein n=1 Tax=Sphingobacterium sp. MYb382 TaxID=2745278 RepID=UPI0030954BA1